MVGYKFLAPGAVSPFTRFRWPAAARWVDAQGSREDAWIHACRPGDLPHWLDEELWRIELGDPAREARYHVVAARARLVARVAAWNPALGEAYARACALRARDLALPHLTASLRVALADLDDLEAIGDAVQRAGPPSHVAGYVADAAIWALRAGPAPASYVACVLASTIRHDLAAFDEERAWQASWLADHLGLRDAHT